MKVLRNLGPAAVRRVTPGLLVALPVHALGALGIVVMVVVVVRFFKIFLNRQHTMPLFRQKRLCARSQF